MNQYFAFVQKHFLAMYAVGIVWMVFLAIISFLYRRGNGKSIFSKVPPNAIFAELWTSGRSLRSIVSRLGGANNCLCVIVTPDQLFVQSHFPFSLLFLPEIYGLDVSIQRSNIQKIEQVSRWYGKSIIITGQTTPNDFLRLELRLRNEEAFLQAMRSNKIE